MKSLRLTLALLSELLAACSSKTIQVSPVESSTLAAQGIVYSLPRTVLSIRVGVARTVTIPGPYAAYAQKYMGISGAPTLESEEYSITTVSIDSESESDPTAIYSAFLKGKSLYDFFQVVSSGIVIPVGDFKSASSTSSAVGGGAPRGVDFKDLSPSPFIAEEKSTFYSRVQRDSSFVRVPVQKSIVVERSLEEKAKEAADFIFSLRKKRLEFMTADVEHPFDGEALKLMFAEIGKLENEYLSLFIGKAYTETASKSILITPANPEGESGIAFRFSTAKGIIAPNDLSGIPILVEIEPETIPESYRSAFASMAKSTSKNRFEQVYYRIPVNALVKISDGKTEMANRRLPIYQYGVTAKLPVKHLLIKQ